MLRAKILYGGLLGILVVFWILYTGKLSFELLVLALGLPLLLLGLLWWARHSVRVTLQSLTHHGKTGEPLRIAVYLNNPTWLPLSGVVLQLSYGNRMTPETASVTLHLPVMARNTARMTLSFETQYCGCMEVRATMLTLYDPLRLFRMRVRQTACVHETMMPRGQELPAADWLVQTHTTDDTDVYATNRSGDDVSELFAIDPYTPGDVRSHIHWKLSSKLDLLMVKKYSFPIAGTVLLLPDYRLPVEGVQGIARLDAMLSTIDSLALQLLEENQQQRFAWMPVDSLEPLEQPVTEPEHIPEILWQILQRPAAAATAPSPLELLEDTIHCVQLLYVTPKLRAADCNALCGMAARCPVTVFAVMAETEVLPTEAEQLMCVPVRLQAVETPAEGAR